ncbi:MAG: hypothetical protein ACTSW1_16650 [Candidatus Hodarchaeales archaeon]
MSIDPIYIKSAIESLDLIQHLLKYLMENNSTAKLVDFLNQIEAKADARVSSSLGQTLGINIPVADQEGKSPKYWEGVRDMARLAIKQWDYLNKDPASFSSFLTNTSSSLRSRISPEESAISPLEDLLHKQQPEPVKKQPASPLEQMLKPEPATTRPVTPPAPKPEPATTRPATPSVPKPEPTPVSQPKSEPIPAPKIIPEPVPKPPTPEPIPTPKITPEPTPKPSVPEPTIPDVTPIKETIEPSTPDLGATPDKIQQLGEKLQSSGLEETVEEQLPSTSSLAKKILEKDTPTVDGDEEDDMLSLSLREALKILRDEDED